MTVLIILASLFAGSFADTSSTGLVEVALPGLKESYAIATHETTVAEFRSFQQTYNPDFKDSNIPANGITFQQAKAFCESRGLRLPTPMEWQRACVGRRQLLFSNMEEYDSTAARVGVRTWSDGPRAVGSYPVNDLGLFDMVGNVWEWVEDKDGRSGLYGGSWVDSRTRAYCAKQIRVSGEPAANYGFRCAR